MKSKDKNKVKGWLICVTGDETVATLRDSAWAYLSKTSEGTELVVNSCNGNRPSVPVEVVEILLDRNRPVSKP